MSRGGVRPNVLILMSDEHRADFAGFAGHPGVRTPHLDALAEDAAVFERCYAPSPICVPSRQAMAAGLHPHRLGVEVMGVDESPPGTMTFARLFSQHGYLTVAAGKLHYMGEDQMQGWRRRVGADQEVWPQFLAGADADAYAGVPRPTDHKWSMVTEIERSGVGDNPLTWEDEYAVRGALHVLHRHFVDAHYGRAVPDAPLLLLVSLNEPHYPYATPDAERFAHHLATVEPFVDQEVFDHPFLGGRFVARAGIEVTAEAARRATAAYCAMIETMDARHGRVLDALRAAGQDLDDWIVVYTSDHGEMLGEHGVWEKQKFFEASARVPLLIRAPGRLPAGRVAANVSLVDLFATLAELAGLPVPDGLDSRSLVGLVTRGADAAGWDDEALSQFDRTHLMIKRGPLKYQWYGDSATEVLFDLDADPTEAADLSGEPRYADALAAFRVRRAALGFA